MVWNCFSCVGGHQKSRKSVKENLDYPWEIYTLKELLQATNNFSNDNKIGEGGFGSVYWGRTSKGVGVITTITYAVKRLKAMTAKAEMEFAVEVEILARVRHENLLGLRGFYAGGDERLIVYDYMPNHSLLSHLHGQLADQCLLDWQRRVSIAIGAAQGLSEDFDDIADPRLEQKFNLEELKCVVSIALRCSDGNAESRPSMKEVVVWLKDGLRNKKNEIGDVKNNEEQDQDEDQDHEETYKNHKDYEELEKQDSDDGT
ncbi:PTI1-like tyrosine-protein kinase, partial [Cucurbita argyrosperma subsp. sororia]